VNKKNKELEQYVINWALIEQQCKEAAQAVALIQKQKEPEVKKKNGRKKKGY
jgi:hypothetical protein